MSNYTLYGQKLIKNDNTLKEFAESLCDGVPTEEIKNLLPLDFKDMYLQLVSSILTDDISRTDIDYDALMYKYCAEIGEILYNIDNSGISVPAIHFFGEKGKISFNYLVYEYIYFHFNELAQR